jgi:hypothetical protein
MVGSELMAKQKVHKNAIKDFEGGRYARTEEELHKKAVMLLDKCKIEPRS